MCGIVPMQSIVITVPRCRWESGYYRTVLIAGCSLYNSRAEVLWIELSTTSHILRIPASHLLVIKPRWSHILDVIISVQRFDTFDKADRFDRFEHADGSDGSQSKQQHQQKDDIPAR